MMRPSLFFRSSSFASADVLVVSCFDAILFFLSNRLSRGHFLSCSQALDVCMPV